MDGLKSKFHPDRFDPIQALQQLQDIRRQTVRSGRDRKGNHIRILYGFRENPFQIICGGIRVGVRLKICNKFADRALLADQFFLGLDLLCDRQGGRGCKVSGTASAAEDAAAVSDCAVAVGAGHPAVQGETIYFFTKTVFHFVIKGMIRLFFPFHNKSSSFKGKSVYF